MKKIILASASPRRRELLKKAGIHFVVELPDYDENISDKEFSYKLVEMTAEKKGYSIVQKVKSPAIIISADTVVIHNDRILDKPKNYENAYKMLKELNGQTHKVVTSVCIIDTLSGKKLIENGTSEVTFCKVSDEEIHRYIKKYKPFDKAGSYGIQELPEYFIKEIKGDYNNIVGLPVKMLKKMIEKIQK